MNFASAPYGIEESWDIPEPLHHEPLIDTSSAYGWDIAPHRHDSLFQLFFLTKGGAQVTLDGKVECHRAPALVFVPPLTVHGFSYQTDSDGHVLTILESAFADILPQTSGLLAKLKSPFILSPDPGSHEQQQLVSAFSKLAEEFHGASEGRLQMLYCHAADILIQAARRRRGHQSSDNAPDNRDHLLARKFTELIDKHFQEHRGNDFYASNLGLSETKLTRMSNAVLGMSPQKALTGRLMLEAKRNLLYTNLSCAQIAFKLGFEDPAYFNRFFKKHTNKTPLQFRKTSVADA